MFTFHLIFLFASLLLPTAAVKAARPSEDSRDPPRSIPNGQLYGITTDDGYDVTDLIDSTSTLPRKIITRIVFDPWISAAEYLPGTSAIYRDGYVMGELLDSFHMNDYSAAQYVRRANEYLSALGNVVDIWEVGNEVNGDWLGATSSVVEKISAAFDVFKQSDRVTALTLYYNAGCTTPDHEMFAWTDTNLPPRMKGGLDYVWVSYYEDDCLGLQPDWQAVFTRLRSMFPNSKLGIGEMGTTDPVRKKEVLARYYNLSKPGTITVPGFVGGYFYWFYRQDMVPKTKPLWAFFYDLLVGLP